MIKVNLLPVRAAAKKESLRVQASIAVLSLIFVSIVLGYLHFSVARKTGSIKVEISGAQKEINSLKSIIAKVNQFKKDREELNKKLDVIKKLNQGRSGPVYLLDELSRLMPDKLWIESLNETGWKLSWAGMALDHDTIASFMTNMEQSAMFGGIRLKSTQQESRAGLSLLKFDIDANFTAPRQQGE